jgi:ligand-binding SRPBCC domain-containing protein
MRFVKESVVRASAATVFAFHERPDALARLTPPWQKVEIVRPPTSLAVGTRVTLRMKVGPFWQTVEAEHVAYEAGRMFADRIVKGPFARWLHRHVVTPLDDGGGDGAGAASCTLTDDIDYALPLGALGAFVGGGFARRELERLFAYRHEVTRAACESARA